MPAAPSSSSQSHPNKPVSRRGARTFEAEVLPGLEPWAYHELAELKGVTMSGSAKDSAKAAGGIAFRYQGAWARLSRLRTVVAVYALKDFEVPRPKALLGQQHFGALVELIDAVRATQNFTGFRISAAGSDSRVFQRLQARLEQATGLAHAAETGELLLRVRKSTRQRGWQVLVRLTPRPLSARPWRACNMQGGLNATVAAVMVELAGVRPQDRYLNAMCGSGTLLIERRARGAAARLVGCDSDPEALACARKNLEASGFLAGATLVQADATSLELPAASVDVVTADLPWGDQIGSHAQNAELYPAFLQEMARLVVPGGRLVLLTHELRLFERLLAGVPAWRLAKSAQLFHGGHYPKVYLLLREAP